MSVEIGGAIVASCNALAVEQDPRKGEQQSVLISGAGAEVISMEKTAAINILVRREKRDAKHRGVTRPRRGGCEKRGEGTNRCLRRFNEVTIR